MENKSGFAITDKKGFHITFNNGYNLSVQFGYGNYCDNKNNREANPYSKSREEKNIFSSNAEISIWKNNSENFCTKEFGFKDDVAGYITPDELATLIEKIVRKLK